MKFTFVSKRKTKKNLIEKIRCSDEFKKIGENDYLNKTGHRFVVSGNYFLIYRECN